MEAQVTSHARETSQQISVWKNKMLVMILSGQIISGIGDHLYFFALPWMIYELTQSTVATGAMRAIEVLPYCLLGLFIGLIVDRFDRRRLMLISVFVQALLIALIPILQSLDIFEIWNLYVIGFCLTTAWFLFNTAYQSIIPSIVDEKMLGQVNGQLGVIMTTMDMVGPMFAGLIIGIVGVTGGLWIDFGTFLFLFFCLYLVKLPTLSSERLNKTESIKKDILDGIRLIIKNPILRNVIILALICNFGMNMSTPLIIFSLRESFGLDSRMTGFILATGAIGALLGNLFSSFIMKKGYPKGMQIIFAVALICLGLITMGMATTVWLFGFGFMLQFFGVVWANVNFMTIRQIVTPREILGRVTSIAIMFSRTAMPIAMLSGGILGAAMTNHWVFLISAFVIFISLLFSIFTSIRVTE